jgi:carboxypeptidase C (cathepsin A)
MKKYFFALAAVCCIAGSSLAQIEPATPKNTNPISKSRILSVDSAVVTKHHVTIKGKLIPYTATAGSMPIWDNDGRPIAGVFYTYYERDDVTDRASRPLVISFNGGPGTPSVWMEIGYTGPPLQKT